MPNYINMPKVMRIGLLVTKMLLVFIFSIPLFGFGEFVFSNEEYSKNIEIEWYLVPQELVSPIFNRSDPELLKKRVHLKVGKIDKSNNQLIERGFEDVGYLIIFVKNNGSSWAWGELNCSIKIETTRELNLTVTYLGITPHTFVYPLSISLHTDPEVKFHWNKLYTKG
jgi:hypothetical protein